MFDYATAIRMYALKHVYNYLNGGHQFAYGISNFNYENYGIPHDQADKDYSEHFNKFWKEIANNVVDEEGEYREKV